MPIQGGVWARNGRPLSAYEVDSFFSHVLEWRPGLHAEVRDGESAFLLIQPIQCPAVAFPAGPFQYDEDIIVTFDGRLDNTRVLQSELGLCPECKVESIVGAGWHRWEHALFERLVGDWALVLWNRRLRRLILACDFLGARRIHYSVQGSTIRWCSGYTPLVKAADTTPKLSRDYLLELIAWRPRPERTPYESIHGLPAGYWFDIMQEGMHLHRYCRLQRSSLLPCRTIQDCEHAFRELLLNAVYRRTVGQSDILADLSGGLDSSSIVCAADALRRRGRIDCRIHTVSCYDPREPSGDERPYFMAVERHIGRAGSHIDLAELDGHPGWAQTQFPCPGFSRRQVALQYIENAIRRANGTATRLVGRGGDEVTGAIPDPIRHLSHELMSLRWSSFLRDLIAWSMAKRRPVIGLATSAFLASLPDWLVPSRFASPHDWLYSSRARTDIRDARARLLGARSMWSSRPDARYDIDHLAALTRPYDKVLFGHQEETFPFLDMDLLALLLFLPASILQAPHERRRLMRGALRGLLPDVVLERRTKWIGLVQPCRDTLRDSCELRHCIEFGITSREALAKAFERAQHGDEKLGLALSRLVVIEDWLSSYASDRRLRRGSLSIPVAKNASST